MVERRAGRTPIRVKRGETLAQVLERMRLTRQPPAFECGARKASGSDPQDCDWPTCGCDAYAQTVIVALEESGALLKRAERDREIVAWLRREADVPHEPRIAGHAMLLECIKRLADRLEQANGGRLLLSPVAGPEPER